MTPCFNYHASSQLFKADPDAMKGCIVGSAEAAQTMRYADA